MRENAELLGLMMRDQAPQAPVYLPGPYWMGYQARSYRAIQHLGISAFRAQPAIGKGFADVVITDPFAGFANRPARMAQLLSAIWPVRSIVREYQTLLRARIEQRRQFQSMVFDHRFGEIVREVGDRIPDTLHGGAEEVLDVGGRRIAAVYVDALARLWNFRARGFAFESTTSYIEIGGGFGAGTHLLLSLFPNVRKVVYVDIPPMTYVATEYLRHFFGDAVRDYGQTRTLDRIGFANDTTREILCLCPWQVPKLDTKADFLFNASSFSEMTPEIVRNYATQVVPNLSAAARLLLILNKPKGSARTTGPADVFGAFAPSFRCDTFVPKWEMPVAPVYALGTRVPQ